MFKLTQSIVRSSTKNQKFLYKFSSQKKALCSDPIDSICKETFEAQGWDVTTVSETLKKDDLLKVIPEYDALVVRSGTQVTEEVFQAGKNLKFVGRAGSGVDNIDLSSATNKGVLVMNTPGGNTVSTAEHTMSLMMSLARNIPQGHHSLIDKKWKRKQYSGVELYGKQIGIVGLGKIGQLVAKWCQAFGMRVVGFDPVLSQEQCVNIGIEPVSLDQLFKNSDFITVHTPLNNKTRDLLNEKTIQQCKDGVRLINCARGGIINEKALLDALNSGKVAGAALDVFTTEPPTEEIQELIDHPKVVCTPHLGASTEEAQIKVAKSIAQQISDASNGDRLFGVVNAPTGFEYSQNPVYQPYIQMGEKLGILQGQMAGEIFKLKEIQITYHGEFLKKCAPIITCSILKGFLNSFEADSQLNLMNSMSRAHELGHEITEIYKEEHNTTKNALEVKYIGQENGTQITQTLLGSCYGANKMSYLISVDDFELFLPLDGNLLLQYNRDQSGVLAQTTNILAQNKINIDNLYLGRLGIGQDALTVIQLDDEIDGKLLKNIKQIPDVKKVYQVNMTQQLRANFSSSQPTQKPKNPNFSSGPCSKHPEYDLQKFSQKQFSQAVLGRSHRSSLGKSRIQLALDKTKAILGLPEDYRVGLVPASDTGAVEMSMWSMFGERPVDAAYWESFGKGWYTDCKNHLKIETNAIGTDNYGEIPDLSKVNPENDLVFAYNGTTSGVKVKNLDFISDNRKGITLADCTSAVFAQDITPYNKLDVITFSWQKVLGGEGAHGILVLSPRAVERLKTYTPPNRPLPKIFRMINKGKLDENLFKHSPINTPSMLCIEDCIDSLEWVERIGGLQGAQQRADSNLQVVENFVQKNQNWIDFLCKDKDYRSNTSVCLTVDATPEEIKQITTLLEKENVAYDIGGYKDAPPSLRIWCGSTVEASDIEIALDWVKYAYEIVKNK